MLIGGGTERDGTADSDTSAAGRSGTALGSRGAAPNGRNKKIGKIGQVAEILSTKHNFDGV